MEVLSPSDASAQETAFKGDLNGDDVVDLADVILAIQVISRLNPAGVRPDYPTSGADVDGNGRIGLGEAIYDLQTEVSPLLKPFRFGCAIPCDYC